MRMRVKFLLPVPNVARMYMHMSRPHNPHCSYFFIAKYAQRVFSLMLHREWNLFMG